MMPRCIRLPLLTLATAIYLGTGGVGGVLAGQWGRADIPVVINEFVASNSNTAMDPQGQYDDWIEIHNYGAVIVNELVAHSHAEATDWIELYNTTDAAIDVGGWFLSDSNDNPFKYEIAAGTVIGPAEYLV